MAEGKKTGTGLAPGKKALSEEEGNNRVSQGGKEWEAEIM